MPKISVVVPCYNASKYIEKTILAFVDQKYKDFEVIFVDDCSTDNTPVVINNLIKKYEMPARLVHNSKNTGPSLARQNGIRNSQSEYIAFCDSDDWYEPEFLTKMYGATENGKIDIVFCNYRLVYDSGRIIDKDTIGDINHYHSKKDVLAIDMDGVCGGLFKRQLFDGLVFPDIRNGEDMALVPLLIYKAESYAFIKDFVYNYYQRSGSLSTSQSKSVVDSLIKSFAYIYKHIDDEQYMNEVEYLGIRNLLYGALLNLFKQGYKIETAKKIIYDFEQSFPKWKKNMYIKQMPSYKRIFLLLIRMHFYLALFFLSKMHLIFTK